MKKIQNWVKTVSFMALSNVALAQQSSNVSVSNVGVINSATLDFSPAFYKDGIVFVSNNDIQGKAKMFDDHIGKKTMSLFLAKRDEKGQLQKPQPFAIELVSQVHEGPLTFARDNKTVFFSRNNHKKAGKAKYVDGIDHMKVFVSRLTNNGWSVPMALPFNQENSDACHPALSSDGNSLYFSSNRAGGFGGMDLYVCKKQGDTWSKAVNLGPNVNSEKNDVFPFVHDDGMVYFSSERKGGSGGMDIYHTQMDQNGAFERPLSIGEPFNSSKDDFGFILEKDRKSGYFTSNRSGGIGEDDIYNFAITEPLKPKEEVSERIIALHVIDKKTGEPLSNALVDGLADGQPLMTDAKGNISLKVARDKDFTLKINKTTYNFEELALLQTDTRSEITVPMMASAEIPERTITLHVVDKITGKPLSNTLVDGAGLGQKLMTDANGNVTLKLNREKDFALRINKDNYDFENLDLLQNDSRSEITIPMVVATSVASKSVTEKKAEVEPAKPVIATPKLAVADVKPERINNAAVYQLKNVYYDFDKSKIRPDASLVLDSLVLILNQFPDLEIELAAYTDSRGKDKYNDALSQRRSFNALNYLIEKGIDSKRIKLKNLGENDLTNECADGVKCPEEKHQMNRRTEVRIVKSGSSEGRVLPAPSVMKLK